MAESLLPGARVCDVAAEYGMIARHLSGWRGLARKGELFAPSVSAPAFVPLVVEAEGLAVRGKLQRDTGVIKVEICGAVVHVTPACSPERPAALVAALRKVLRSHKDVA